jgi:hypothetical protein
MVMVVVIAEPRRVNDGYEEDKADGVTGGRARLPCGEAGRSWIGETPSQSGRPWFWKTIRSRWNALFARCASAAESFAASKAAMPRPAISATYMVISTPRGTDALQLSRVHPLAAMTVLITLAYTNLAPNASAGSVLRLTNSGLRRDSARTTGASESTAAPEAAARQNIVRMRAPDEIPGNTCPTPMLVMLPQRLHGSPVDVH